MKVIGFIVLHFLTVNLIYAQTPFSKLFKQKYPEGYVPVPAGTFMMGSNYENIFNMPDIAKQVSISNFFLKETEVTNKEYMRFVKWTADSLQLAESYEHEEVLYRMGDNNTVKIYPDTTAWNKDEDNYAPAYFSYFSSSKYENYPVVGVSFEQAEAYCHWKTITDNSEDIIYHLPTEAQWEYAAGIADEKGKRNKFPWPGEDCKTLKGIRTANYKIAPGEYVGSGSGEVIYTKRVKEYFPNYIGLYDMGGNVSEWCLDSYTPVYTDFDRDPVFIDENSDVKVIRGGSWKDPWYFMQCAARCFTNKNTACNYIGFRVAGSVVGAESRHEYYNEYFR